MYIIFKINKLKHNGLLMATFIGFSTIDKYSPSYTLTDIDLIKRDILNEFQTRMGERVMRPTFGTIIYDLLMDPMDDQTVDDIKNDAVRIVNKEPRVELNEVVVTAEVDIVIVEISLFYGPQKLQESLYVSYQLDTEATYEAIDPRT
jgi:phage baseplate assembly protein W